MDKAQAWKRLGALVDLQERNHVETPIAAVRVWARRDRWIVREIARLRSWLFWHDGGD